jgi:alkylglycerol monooxygenase
VTLDSLILFSPLFGVALILEGRALRHDRRALISGLGCVALDQLTAAWGLGLFLVGFAALHDAAGTTLASGATGWVVAVVAHDVAYYAFHRASHRINLLWAAHVVHHQSAAYDFTVSLRQGAVATWVTYAFYLPVALIVDPTTFVVVHAAYQVYQFFVHTRAIRRLGPLEWILATPSHHRVHHGSERHHLDRNYGGFFILFDRLFGTFEPERREPVYGVPGGFELASPLAANTYLYLRLHAVARRLPTTTARLRLWFGPPEASAHLVSAAGHPPRIGQRPAVGALVAGFAGTGVVVLAAGALPVGVLIAVGVASAMLIERGCAPLDRGR